MSLSAIWWLSLQGTMSGCRLQEIDLEVYLQDTHWGVLLRTTPVRNCRKQDWGEREIKLQCTQDRSPNSGAGQFFTLFQIGAKRLGLSPHVGYRLLLRRVCAYPGQGGPLHCRQFPERNSAVSPAATDLSAWVLRGRTWVMPHSFHRCILTLQDFAEFSS